MAAGTGDPRAHGTDGHADDLRDLRVPEAPEVAQEKCLALFRRKLIQGHAKLIRHHPFDGLRRDAIGLHVRFAVHNQ
jgi:hypothetical protein